MRCHRMLSMLVITGVSVAACGSDGTPLPTVSESTMATTTDTNEPGTTGPVTSTTPPAGDQTPGLWPPGGAGTPEDAVSAFVRDLLDVEPNIGDYRSGDARSGEIDVLGPAEAPGVRATAFVRQLGPDDEWFVIGAASDGVTISTPETGATVPAGPLEVDGLGRGFESTIAVRALLTDADATELDVAIGAGGPIRELEPYGVTLDLSDAETSDTVILLARGDSGLSDDPGEFSAIAVVIG